MLNRKGFLGPIGDDLPSLIPLVFALTIFFAVFYLTFNTFNERTQDFDNDTSAVQISAALRGTGFIASSEDFTKLCGNINVTRLDYFAGIIKAEEYSSGYIEWNALNEELRCNNSVNQDNSDIPIKIDLTKKNLQLVQRIYPIAVATDFEISGKIEQRIAPSFLVVTVWRNGA
ncbi:MAG: hypothetical protein Q7S21_02165 [archaeon]|nr:hypothetical protein [archaeon]